MIGEATIPARFTRERIGAASVLLVPSPGCGLIALELHTLRGSVDEPPEDYGVAAFAAGMLKRGTRNRTSREIAFELESLGAFAGHGAGLDAAESSLRSAAADFYQALPVVFDCLRDPIFDAREFENERKTRIAALLRAEDEKFELTHRRYMKAIFAGHGYGHPGDGEIEWVERITPDQCRSWHARTYLLENFLIVVAGDFDPAEMTDALREELERWSASRTPTPRAAVRKADAPPPTPIEVEKEDLEQGFIIAGFRTPPLIHAHHPALRISSAALGEGFSGRLFTILRDQRSLAYTVGSSLNAYRLAGHAMLHIGTEPGRLGEALEGLMEQVEFVKNNALSDEDLSRAIQFVVGKYVMSHQSLAARAGHLARWEDLGGGAEQDDIYPDRLRAVTARDVQEAARRWWVDPTTVILRPKS